MHAVGSNGEPAPSFQSADSQQVQQLDDVMAFYQHLVAETKVIGPANRYEQPSSRKPLVNRSEVRKDLLASRIGHFPAVIAEEKHKRLLEALLNDAPIRSSINIDPRLAPRIVMAELQRRSAAERMPEHAEPLQIQTTREFAGWVSGIHALQLAHHKFRIAGPHQQKSVDQATRLVGWQILGIVRRRSADDAAVLKDDDELAVTCQILRERREVRGQGSAASPHNHHWIGALLWRDVRIRCAMRLDPRQISHKKPTHQSA